MAVYDGVNKLKGSIALVGCKGHKLHADSAAAVILFRGSTFIAARDYAMNKFDGWFILSAKYGLLHPNKHVSYHDMELAAQSPEYRAEWAQVVATAIRETIELGSILTFLCGQEYWEELVTILTPDYTFAFPLLLLSEDDQLKWLREQVDDPPPG